MPATAVGELNVDELKRPIRQDIVKTSPMRATKLATITIFLTLVVSFSIAEIIVRAVFPFSYSPDALLNHSIRYIPAVYAQHLLAPVDKLIQLGVTEDTGENRRIFISGNGYRGPSFTVRKRPEITRIIVLGGSAVFDQNVFDETPGDANTWPNLVGRLLEEKGYDGVEVINAGVPGHSSADSLGRLYGQLWMYEPDFVLVYHAWNDIKFWRRHEISPERPLISQIEPYDPSQDPFITYRGVWDRVLSHSQFYLKSRNRYYRWRTGLGAEGATSPDTDRSSEYGIYGPQQFRLNMQLIVSACQTLGVTPILITQATLAVSDSSADDRARISYEFQHLDHGAIVSAFDQTYRIINEIGAHSGALVIDVAHRMNGRSELFADHVHTTQAGSKELARIVADELGPILDRAHENPSEDE